MNDGLRAGGLVPLQEPYTALGWSFVGGGDETIDAAVLTVGERCDRGLGGGGTSGQERQHRGHREPTALLQRDGDIVDLDGTSALQVDAPADDHYIAVFHRNHLGVLTFNTVALEQYRRGGGPDRRQHGHVRYGRPGRGRSGLPPLVRRCSGDGC